MEPLIFIYTHDDIFEGVKQESSQLGVRQRDESGSLFDRLVFDEAYFSKFRELFFDAQSEVAPVVSRYAEEIEANSACFETQDFSTNRDYMFTLFMPDRFMMSMKRPVYICIRQFFIAYILYRWLETKLPDVSSIYLVRANETLLRVKALLEMRSGPTRRAHRLW